jgi:preprotein translocase subunit SecE
MADKMKFATALLLVVAGIAGFYVLAEQALVVRVMVVLLGIVAGSSVAWFTEPGQRFVVLGRESVAEAKKVVWPSRKETMQTTGIVFAFVLAMAIMLWITDKSLEWVLYDLILGWKK